MTIDEVLRDYGPRSSDSVSALLANWGLEPDAAMPLLDRERSLAGLFVSGDLGLVFIEVDHESGAFKGSLTLWQDVTIGEIHGQARLMRGDVEREVLVTLTRPKFPLVVTRETRADQAEATIGLVRSILQHVSGRPRPVR